MFVLLLCKMEDCSICLESLEYNATITLPCKHRYHKRCINKWFTWSRKCICPLCKKEERPFNQCKQCKKTIGPYRGWKINPSSKYCQDCYFWFIRKKYYYDLSII